MSELLPPSSTALERRLTEACSDTDSLPVPIRSLWNADECPVRLLPWLAWSLSVDDWDPAWDESAKRAAVKASLPIHKKKGTIGAVRKALAALGYGVRVQEWFAQIPSATPYTFRLWLDIEEVGIPQAALLRIVDVVTSTKNLRSQMSEIVPTISSRNQTFSAGALGLGIELDIGALSIFITGPSEAKLAVGSVVSATGKMRISGAMAERHTFQSGTVAGAYGSLTVTTDGTWTYTLDTSNPSVAALTSETTITDTVCVFSDDRSASRAIAVSISGEAPHVALLLVSDGAKVYDATGRHSVENLGAVVDGDGILFGRYDGYLNIKDSPDFCLGSSDFTLEFIVRPAYYYSPGLYCQSEGSGATSKKIVISYEGNWQRWSLLVVDANGTATTIFNAGVPYGTGSKHHLEFGRRGDTWYMFAGGQLIATAAASISIPDIAADLAIGAPVEGGVTGYGFGGRLYGVRLTKGLCRHTEPFSPPSSLA